MANLPNRNKMEENDNPLIIVENIFINLSNFFITSFLTIIDDKNNMMDSIQNLMVNYELLDTNNAAAINIILSIGSQKLRMVEDTNWKSMNILFRD
jgi:hypothetical protein